MKLFAMMNWFDEPPAWLAATITSLARAGVGHVIVVDGAYHTFPDRRPRSSADQADAIVLAADAADMGLTLVRPRRAWDSEVAKRDAMFRMLAGAGAVAGEDWVLLIDADEVVSDVDVDELWTTLQATDALVARALLWAHQPPANEAQQEAALHLECAGEIARAAQHRIYRVIDNMRVEHAHYCYLGEHHGETYQLFLHTPELEGEAAPTVDVLSLRIEHRELQRSARRRAQKREYYTERDELGLEQLPAR